jgi:hypothetical protein
MVGKEGMDEVNGGGINEGALVVKMSKLDGKEKEIVASSNEFQDEAVILSFLEHQFDEVDLRLGVDIPIHLMRVWFIRLFLGWSYHQ